MRMWFASIVLLAGAVVLGAPAVRAGTTLVLPFSSLGVDPVSADVARDLLAGELRERGWTPVALSAEAAAGAGACAEPACANDLAAGVGAERVVYGSLSRLGAKVIVRLEALRAGEAAPFYSEQFSEGAIEDLDRVMARAAEAMVAGRASADRPTVDTVVPSENEEPLRRASRKGIGFRAGMIFPTGGSYSGEDQLTTLSVIWSRETRDLLVETTPFTGFAWADNAHEWVLFNLFVAKLLNRGDWSPYLGGGFGLHSVQVRVPVYNSYPDYVYYTEEASTVFVLDAGAGLLALRTFDFTLNLELRYHYTFRDYEGEGAHGFWLSVGTGR